MKNNQPFSQLLNLTGIALDESFLTYYDTLIGMDEVGRGCIAGPVMCCALSLTKEGINIKGLNDSKKLTPKKREMLFKEIIEKTHFTSLGIAFPFEIDRINIYQATILAMNRALLGINEIHLTKKTALIIDALKIEHPQMDSYPLVKADSKSPTVMAASIVAKVTRDALMNLYSHTYPQYGFEKHKGYGTALHKKNYDQFGNCPLHRKSFRF